jgi:hypothetical protein
MNSRGIDPAVQFSPWLSNEKPHWANADLELQEMPQADVDGG